MKQAVYFKLAYTGLLHREDSKKTTGLRCMYFIKLRLQS